MVTCLKLYGTFTNKLLRFKFDDDRVTPATLTEVLEDNYGGIPLHPPSPGMKNVNRTTSAYMLVYIRESMQEEVLSQVTQNDIPQHLGKRESSGETRKSSFIKGSI